MYQVVGSGHLHVCDDCNDPNMEYSSAVQDPICLFFTGSAPFLTLCIGIGAIVLVYSLSVLLIFRFAKDTDKTDHMLLLILPIFLTAFGFLFLIVYMPLERTSNEVHKQILTDCSHGSQTQDLYGHTVLLHRLRIQPNCLSEPSVERCSSFGQTAIVTFLKAMENKYQCSGFCSSTYTNSTPPVSLLQIEMEQNQGRHRSQISYMPHDIKMRSARARKFQDPQLYSSEASERLLSTGDMLGMAMQPRFLLRPPALFSPRFYTVSCSGMAARQMKLFVGGVGLQLYYEGLLLIVVAIVLTFTRLFGAGLGHQPAQDGCA